MPSRGPTSDLDFRVTAPNIQLEEVRIYFVHAISGLEEAVALWQCIARPRRCVAAKRSMPPRRLRFRSC